MSNARRLLTSTDKTSIENRIAETSGKSAYEIAKQYGFEGTEQEWIEALEYRPADYITGHNTKTINGITWEYDIYHSGKVVANGQVAVNNLNVNLTSGSSKYNSIGPFSFPMTFSSMPYMYVWFNANTGYTTWVGSGGSGGTNNVSTSHTGKIFLFRST